MPNIISQEVTKDLVSIVRVPGVTFTLTRSAVKTYYQAQTGTAATRKQKTITWVINSLIAAMGEGWGSASSMTFNVDTVNDAADMLLQLRTE